MAKLNIKLSRKLEIVMIQVLLLTTAKKMQFKKEKNWNKRSELIEFIWNIYNLFHEDPIRLNALCARKTKTSATKRIKHRDWLKDGALEIKRQKFVAPINNKESNIALRKIFWGKFSSVRRSLSGGGKRNCTSLSEKSI